MVVRDESLSEAFRTVKIPPRSSLLRKVLAFMGPGFLISVGYMDPGNWATDLEGGARYGYRLLWVVLLSNLVAILLQTLCVRLGLVTGKDLAQACRIHLRKPASIALWLLCELAIIACDLAEVIGSAIALQLLFGIPLIAGVAITTFDVLMLLGLSKFGFRKLEAVVITLVATVAGCFLLQTFLAKPDFGMVAKGLLIPTLPEADAVVISLGIIGATVMPHNLYLHSAIVQTRAHERTANGIREAIRFNTWDTIGALGAAFFVNAAILVLAGTVFDGRMDEVRELGDAQKLLKPILGGVASTAFAIALLAAGQSSTITGTLAGQIVMEGFLDWKIAPHIRRIVTRLLAVVPAMVIIIISGGHDTTRILTWSQVVLSLQLPFAIIPLIVFTNSKKVMREFANPLWMTVLSVISASVIIGLNLYLVWERLGMTSLLGIVASVALFATWVRFGYKERNKA
ncbi:MAG: Nramp family divalent metal transporter [Armatimonadota bacterium]